VAPDEPGLLVMTPFRAPFSRPFSRFTIQKHHNRITCILGRLVPGFKPKARTGLTKWVWIGFHSGVIVLGVTLLVVFIMCLGVTR
jgi:hypothetical protein